MSTQTLTRIAITGNTYPVKDKLKALGCKWDGARKCWVATSEDMAAKARAIVGNTPLNSPPQQDLGPVDAAAECAKHGRKALSDKTVPFRRASSKAANETGTTFWGKCKGSRNRYLVVRSGRPYYLSASTLEDFDDFTSKPGYYVDCDCVAVEPTADEIAKDPAVAKAKAEALENRRYEIISEVQKGANAADPTDARMRKVSVHGMTKCWGKCRMAGHENLWSDGTRLVYETSSYDDSPAAWEIINEALAKEALEIREVK